MSPSLSSPCIDLETDTHVHTYLCNHATGAMEEYVEQARVRGLKKIFFLEHLEAGICTGRPRTWLDITAFDHYIQEGRRLQRRYEGRIAIGLGVEAGYNGAAAAALEAGLARYPWDRVGLSCHFYHHEGRSFNLLSRHPESLGQLERIGTDRVVGTYLDNLIEGVERIGCDAVCHLDAVLRHLPGGIRLNAAHRRQIESLLNSMRAREVALEINTSGFEYRDFPFPDAWIVAAAMERGIPLAAASDAHRPEDVGRHFSRLPEWLAALTF